MHINIKKFIFLASGVIILIIGIWPLVSLLLTLDELSTETQRTIIESLIKVTIGLTLLASMSKRKREEEIIKKRGEINIDASRKREIIQEIRKAEERAWQEARQKYPIGKALIGRIIKLPKEVIVKLDEEPTLIKGSFKVHATKLLAGEEVKILDVDLENYIIQAKNIKKGYLEFDQLKEEFDKQIDKQTEAYFELFDKYFNEIIKKYKLSPTEASILRSRLNKRF